MTNPFYRPISHVQPAAVSGSPDYENPAITNIDQNWQKYLSLPFRTQWAGSFDEENCSTRSAIECLEAILNYYLMNNLFTGDLGRFLKEKYCNSQGYVKLSIRYNAKLNNTTPSGVSVDTVWNNFGVYGIIPETLYPDPPVPFSWGDYYSPVPDDIVAFGKNTLTLFKIVWRVIQNNSWNVPNIDLLRKSLTVSPIQMAGPLWKTDSNGIQKWDGKKNYVHARVIYAEDNFQEVLDSYSASYLEKMNQSFPVPCAIQCAIKIV